MKIIRHILFLLCVTTVMQPAEHTHVNSNRSVYYAQNKVVAAHKTAPVQSRCDALYQRHGGTILLCCGLVSVYVALYYIIFGSMQLCGSSGTSSSSSCQWDTIMEG